MSNQFCKVFAVGEGHQLLVVADEDNPKILCTTLIDGLFVRMTLGYNKDTLDRSFQARDAALVRIDQAFADKTFEEAKRIVEPNMVEDDA